MTGDMAAQFGLGRPGILGPKGEGWATLEVGTGWGGGGPPHEVGTGGTAGVHCQAPLPFPGPKGLVGVP